MKIWTWEMLEQAVHKGDILEAIDDATYNLKPLMALALSVAKWSPDHKMRMYYGEINLMGDENCGLCMYWSDDQDGYKGFMCDLCPLGNAGCECNAPGSLWRDAVDAKARKVIYEFEKAHAALYNKLVELYTEEYFNVWPKSRKGKRHAR